MNTTTIYHMSQGDFYLQKSTFGEFQLQSSCPYFIKNSFQTGKVSVGVLRANDEVIKVVEDVLSELVTK